MMISSPCTHFIRMKMQTQINTKSGCQTIYGFKFKELLPMLAKLAQYWALKIYPYDCNANQVKKQVSVWPVPNIYHVVIKILTKSIS